MQDKLKRLLFDIRGADEQVRKKVAAIAERASKRRRYLVIDLKEMESIVNPDKVEELDVMPRMEIDL